MNNPELPDLRLNFTNIFRKVKSYQFDAKETPPSHRNSSKQNSKRQPILHRTANFVPKHPFEKRIGSSHSYRKEKERQQGEQYGIFSLKALQNKSLGWLSQQIQARNLEPKSRIIVTIKHNDKKSIKADKFQIFRQQGGPIQRKTTIRGLRVRTGSQVKKNRPLIQFDYNNVMVTGHKIFRS